MGLRHCQRANDESTKNLSQSARATKPECVPCARAGEARCNTPNHSNNVPTKCERHGPVTAPTSVKVFGTAFSSSSSKSSSSSSTPGPLRPVPPLPACDLWRSLAFLFIVAGVLPSLCSVCLGVERTLGRTRCPSTACLPERTLTRLSDPVRCASCPSLARGTARTPPRSRSVKSVRICRGSMARFVGPGRQALSRACEALRPHARAGCTEAMISRNTALVMLMTSAVLCASAGKGSSFSSFNLSICAGTRFRHGREEGYKE